MQSRRAFVRLGLACLCLAVGAFMAVPALMDRSAPANDDLAPGMAAMRATLDPETGELVIGPGAAVANDEDGVSLDKMLSRSTEGLVEIHHPDGSVSVKLDNRFMNASVARIAADGTVETLCAEDHDEAQDFLDAAGEAQPAPETDANGWEVR